MQVDHPSGCPEVAYLEELAKEFPRLRVIEKDNDPLSLLIDRALKLVTAGGQSAYMSSYVTTLGSRIYVPANWKERDAWSRYVTMRHEAVHLRQFKRFSFLGMSAIYLMPFFPLGLAYGRARIEWEAYRETLVATAEVWGVEAIESKACRANIVHQFTSAAYGWMWPFPNQINAWIDQAIEEIKAAR